MTCQQLSAITVMKEGILQSESAIVPVPVLLVLLWILIVVKYYWWRIWLRYSFVTTIGCIVYYSHLLDAQFTATNNGSDQKKLCFVTYLAKYILFSSNTFLSLKRYICSTRSDALPGIQAIRPFRLLMNWIAFVFCGEVCGFVDINWETFLSCNGYSWGYYMKAKLAFVIRNFKALRTSAM